MSRLRPNTSAIAPVTGAVKATARVLAVMIVLIWAAVAPNSRESSGNNACGEYRLRNAQNPLIAMARRRRSKVIRSNALGVETHYARGVGRKHHAVSARTGRAGRMARNHILCRPQGSIEVAGGVDLHPSDRAERVTFLLADDRRVGVGGVTGAALTSTSAVRKSPQNRTSLSWAAAAIWARSPSRANTASTIAVWPAPITRRALSA